MTPVELVARREALGLSLNALGEVWDVRTQSISRWEHGTNPPKDWSWIDASITALEQYQAELVDQMVKTTKEILNDTGEAALVTYKSRGVFYRWHPEARDMEWPGGGQGVPVELHRAATARAAAELRITHGIENVSITEAPDVTA